MSDVTPKFRAIHEKMLHEAQELLARPDADQIPPAVRAYAEQIITTERQKIADIDAGISVWKEPV